MLEGKSISLPVWKLGGKFVNYDYRTSNDLQDFFLEKILYHAESNRRVTTKEITNEPGYYNSLFLKIGQY